MSLDNSVVQSETAQVGLTPELKRIAERTGLPYVVIQEVANVTKSLVGAEGTCESCDPQPESHQSSIGNGIHADEPASVKKHPFLSETLFHLEIKGDGRVLLLVLAAIVVVGTFAVI